MFLNSFLVFLGNAGQKLIDYEEYSKAMCYSVSRNSNRPYWNEKEELDTGNSTLNTTKDKRMIYRGI